MHQIVGKIFKTPITCMEGTKRKSEYYQITIWLPMADSGLFEMHNFELQFPKMNMAPLLIRYGKTSQMTAWKVTNLTK